MAAPSAGQIENVMQESRVFPPPAAFAARSGIGSLAAYEALYKEAEQDIPGFWGRLAKELQ